MKRKDKVWLSSVLRSADTKPGISKYAAKVERRRKLALEIGTVDAPLPVLVNGEHGEPVALLDCDGDYVPEND